MNATQLARIRAELPNMSLSEREHVVRLLRDYVAPERPADFIRRMSPHLSPPRHIQPILDLFERGEVEGDPLGRALGEALWADNPLYAASGQYMTLPYKSFSNSSPSSPGRSTPS